MDRFGLVVLTLAALLVAPAAADDTIWTRRFFNGTSDQGRGAAVIGTDVYVAVKTLINTVDFTSVVKYRADGETAWTRRLNLDTTEQVFGAAAMPDSGVVVGTMVPGPSPKVRLARLTGGGDTVWTRIVFALMGTGIAADNSGNVFIWGSAPGQTPVDSVKLVKLNAAGVLQASRAMKLGQAHQGGGCAVDGSGNVYCVASVTDTVQKALVIRFNNSGDTVWKRFPSELTGGRPAAVACDPSGNSYISAAVGPSGRLVKMSASGSVIWSRPVSGTVPVDGYQSVAFNRDSCAFVAVAGDSQFLVLYKYTESGVQSARNICAVPATAAAVRVGVDNRPVVAGQTLGGAMQCLTVKFAGYTGVEERPAGSNRPTAATILAGPNRSLAVTTRHDGDCDVRLVDCAGRTAVRLHAGFLPAGTSRFALPWLAAGVYYLDVGPGAGVAARVVVVR